MLLTVDIIMLGSLILFVILLISMPALSWRPVRCYGVTNRRQEAEKTIAITLRNAWLFSSIAFKVVYYWCILNSILSTLIVLHLGCFDMASGSSLPEIDIRGRLILYSAVSLFTTICPYVINFQKLSKKYRNAFNSIELSLLSNSPYCEAIKEGENQISVALDEND